VTLIQQQVFGDAALFSELAAVVGHSTDITTFVAHYVG